MRVTVKHYGQKCAAAVFKTLPVLALSLFVYGVAGLSEVAQAAQQILPTPQPVADTDTLSAIAENIVISSSDLPGLLAALSYLLGILLGVLGIYKIKDHVESPSQNPARNGYIRLAAGGILFALPILYEAMFNTINGGSATTLLPLQGKLDKIGGLASGGGLGETVNDLANNIVQSSEGLPGIIAAACYMLGILLGVLGILKIKDHVENPSQTPLRTGIIRLIAGGALFALPVIYNAVFTTISGGTSNLGIDTGTERLTQAGGIVAVANISLNFNAVLRNILGSINSVPFIISAAAYLLGLILGATAIIKAKDHVESPEQNPLKDSVLRFLIAGALFALPTIYNVMSETVSDGATNSGANSLFGTIIAYFASARPYEAEGCLGIGFGGASTMGEVMCSITSSTGMFPAFLAGISYVIGLIFGFWGIMKIKAHVQNPQQVGLWDPVSRLLAGGAFLAMPFIVEVARSAFLPGLATVGVTATSSITGYNNPGGGSPAGGLDQLLKFFMSDMMGPLYVGLNFFCMLAGIIFIMVGISRLIKTAQDGPKGPGGLGTIMTFVTGGALLSLQPLIRAFNASAFGTTTTKTYARLDYQSAMTIAERDAAHGTITAIIQFVIIVGLISFVRGIFIIRGVGEGSQGASIMSGITHILAGTLAVNLGPLLNAVQATLGLTGYGITFD
jgi:hypothetical protein